MVCAIEAAWESTWRGKIALLQGDLQTFGALMNENHRLVDEMMTACGVADGAGWANNLFIKTARKNGALGAKLTGAAGGGSVVALVRPGEEAHLSHAWESEAKAAGLKNTWIFHPKIVARGLTVKKGN
jgi:mevalonate kinase